jgi:hypothetical protein
MTTQKTATDHDPEQAYFAVSDLDPTKVTVTQGEEVAVSATIENTGDEEATQDVALELAAEEVDSKQVTLEGGEAQNVGFNIVTDELGGKNTYLIVTDDEMSALIVTTSEIDDRTSENDILSYVPSADVVFQNHPFSEDEDAAVEVLSPERESSGWLGRCGSIEKHEGEYYIVERARVGLPGRGRYIRAHKRTGAGFSADNWAMQWEVDNDSAGVAAASFEELTVRNYDNTWYLYFSYQGDEWQVAYVSAPTFSELGSQLSDSANWETIVIGTDEKDPNVRKIDGDYYMNYQELAHPNYELPVIKSGTPDFDSFTTIDNSIMQQFVNQHGSVDDTNPGTIVYDAEKESYILWMNVKQGDNVYSVYAVSPDLTEDSFSYTNRDIEFSAPVTSSDFRYPDYHSPSDGGTVVILEYSGMNFSTDSTVDENSLYLWDYL